nr:MAG TPA: hypothetical protein [Caudoviricetes sp.]
MLSYFYFCIIIKIAICIFRSFSIVCISTSSCPCIFYDYPYITPR